MKKLKIAAAALTIAAVTTAGLVGLGANTAAKADTGLITICRGDIEPVTATICAGVFIIGEEVFVAKHPFGPNGVVASGLRTVRNWVAGNFQAAKRKDPLDGSIHALTGIDLADGLRCPIRGCSPKTPLNQLFRAFGL